MKRAAADSLFDHAREERLRTDAPLAARMRPRTLAEYIGQDHILAPGRLLRRAIQADQLSSLLFYGPPGTGKTTLAAVIANTTSSAFVTMNAVMTGLPDLRNALAEAKRRLGEYGQRTILFIDEVHRWNRAQQDALLPWVENGTVILIGATTENPYFTVNRALVSRSRIFQLKPLTDDNIRAIINQAIADSDRGFGKLKIRLDDDALEHLSNVANGDARAALNALELAVETTPPEPSGTIHLTLAVAEESIQHRAVLYDREGDYHFDTISAFIKSMRGSDPDAAFYWLAKMVYAGEDPRFIFRRMVIFASEDIGMADPHALQVVMAAAQAFDRIGLPEGHFPLAHAALYCATAPKSNSVMGFFDALKLVEHERDGEVPNHLRDASQDSEGFGHGVGYKYPHEYRQHWVAQQYLPTSLQGRLFYEPGEIGYEAALAAQIRERRELQLSALRANEIDSPPEILSFTPGDAPTEQWLARAVGALSGIFATIRAELFKRRKFQRHELILDISADTGLFTWEAVRRVPEGGVWSLVRTQEAGRILLEQSRNLPGLRQPKILVGGAPELAEALAAAGDSEVRFDYIVGRNLLSAAGSSAERLALINTLREHLRPGGTVALAENIPSRGQRLSQLAGMTFAPELSAAEERIYNNPEDPLVNWDEMTLAGEFSRCGFEWPAVELIELKQNRTLAAATLQRWFNDEGANSYSYAARLKNTGLSADAVTSLYNALAACIGQEVRFTSHTAIISANAT